MESFLERIRNSFRRAGDRLTGHHVPVLSHAPAVENLQSRQRMIPAVDILESDEEVLIVADTPGAFPDNTWVYSEAGDGLSLYVRRDARELPGRVWGDDLSADWYRSFELPEYVDAAAARVTLKAGVLSMHLPKRDVASPIVIPIAAS